MDVPYEHSATAYDVLHAARGKDYAREAGMVAARIRGRRPNARSVLDVACGTGLHLAALVELGFEVEGVDLSPAMLAVAGDRLTGVRLHQGDMRTFRLGRRFDAVVCLYSAIGYMLTLADLGVAVANLVDHLVPGGLLVVEPWFEPEDWVDGWVHGAGAQRADLAVARASRSWREGNHSMIEMRYALATPDRTWSFTELHRMGLFTIADQLDVYRAAGLAVDYDVHGLTGRGLIVAEAPP